MNPIAEAAAALKAALDTVPNSTTYTDPGAQIRPRAIVIGPPSLQWEGLGGPTNGRFLVFAVVDANAQAVQALADFVVEIAAAVDGHTDGVVLRADPAAFTSGTTPLPAYEIQVEVPL